MKQTAILGTLLSFVLIGCGGPKTITKGGTMPYEHEKYSQLQGDARTAAAEQIIRSVSPAWMPDSRVVFVAPGGSLKKIGIGAFDANIMMLGGGRKCCNDLFPWYPTQQALSERMLAIWTKALEKYATPASGITVVPVETITKSAAYQKFGTEVKDYQVDKNKGAGLFTKNNCAFFTGGGQFVGVSKSDYAVPRGMRLFTAGGGASGGAAYQYMGGEVIRAVGAELGLDALITIHTTFDWETDRMQMLSEHMKGVANMSISASLNVPNGRWAAAAQAVNQKLHFKSIDPGIHVYNVGFKDKVKIPLDNNANTGSSCERPELAAEADEGIFNPMLAEYEEVVDMLVAQMVADLQETHKEAVAK